jgi:hypothetical protein
MLMDNRPKTAQDHFKKGSIQMAKPEKSYDMPRESAEEQELSRIGRRFLHQKIVKK